MQNKEERCIFRLYFRTQNGQNWWLKWKKSDFALDAIALAAHTQCTQYWNYVDGNFFRVHRLNIFFCAKVSLRNGLCLVPTCGLKIRICIFEIPYREKQPIDNWLFWLAWLVIWLKQIRLLFSCMISKRVFNYSTAEERNQNLKRVKRCVQRRTFASTKFLYYR